MLNHHPGLIFIFMILNLRAEEHLPNTLRQALLYKVAHMNLVSLSSVFCRPFILVFLAFLPFYPLPLKVLNFGKLKYRRLGFSCLILRTFLWFLHLIGVNYQNGMVLHLLDRWVMMVKILVQTIFVFFDLFKIFIYLFV